MDVLSEVLEALEFESTGVETITVDRIRQGRSTPAQACVVLSGSCQLRLAEKHTALQLHSLNCFLYSGDGPYRLEPIPGGPASPARLLCCAYSFGRALPHPFTRRLPELLLLRSRYVTDESELGRAARLLEEETINARLGFDFVALRLAEIVLVEMLRRCQLEGAPPVFLAALSDPAAHLALQRIHGNPAHPWQVRELAKSVGLSRRAFAERFHRRVGEPPLRYLRHWRMLRALRALRRSETPIKEVALRSGYRSGAGFSRAFRRLFGRSPSSLRQPR